MADIIEKGLNLRVQGEDLASDVFASLADSVTALEQQFEDAFAGMSSFAEDAASAIADAGNSFAAAWVEQLTGLESLAASTFDGVSASAASAAKTIADAAAGFSSAWDAALGSVDTSAAGAAASLDSVGVSASDASAVLADAGVSAGDASAGLADISANAGSANGVLAELAVNAADASAALATLAPDADTVSGSLDSIGASGDAGSVLGDVAKQAGDAAAALADLSPDAKAVDNSLGLIGGDAAAATVLGDVAKQAADASAALGDLSPDAKTVDTALGLIGGDADAATVLGDIAKSAGDASAALADLSPDAKVANTALDSIASDAAAATVLGDIAKQAADADAALAALGTTAATTAAEVDALTGGSGGVAAGTGRKAATTAENDTKGSSGLLGDASIGSLANNAFLGLLGTTLTLGGASASVGSMQSIGFLAEQLGVSVQKALQVELAASGVGATNIEKISTRLETSLQAVERQGTPMLQGQPVSIGLGRQAVEPESLKALLETGSISSQAAGLSLLFGSPKSAAAQLQGEDPTVQLAQISAALEKISNANERIQIASDLFGARQGASVLPLLEHFQQGMSGASSLLAANPDILKQVEKDLSPAGMKGAMGYQESLKLSEIGLEAGLAGLTPALTKLTDSIVKLEDWLEKELGQHGTIHKVAHAVVTAPTKAHDWVSTNTSLNSSSPFDTDSSSPAAKALGLGFDQIKNMQAIEQAAKKYGVNPDAMLAASYAESARTFSTTISNPDTGAQGLFQFMHSTSVPTWQHDYEAVYGKAPSGPPGSYNADVQADVAGYAMKKSGIGGQKDVNAALQDILVNFENPGPAGVASDTSVAAQFLKLLEGNLDKSASTIQSKTPELTHASAAAINALIKEAEQLLPNYTKEHGKAIDDTLKLLESKTPSMTTIGTDLMEGLLHGIEAEEPKLTGEAQKIAQKIEAELRKAVESHSPSEMTARIGADLMAGLGVGMERATPAAAAVAARAATHVAGGVGGAAGTGAGGGVTVVANVYLDGKLITSQVQDGIFQNMRNSGRMTLPS